MKTTTAIKEPNYQAIQEQLFVEQNKLRANPSSYIKKLEEYLNYFKDTDLYMPGEDPVTTLEGKLGVSEAIKFLKRQKSVSALKLVPELCKACNDHVLDIGPNGLITHEGSDDKTVSDRIEKYCEWDDACAESMDFGYKIAENIIANLIVDDGAKEKFQRKNLFNPDFKYVGIAVGPHRDYGICSVIAYTKGIRALGEESQNDGKFLQDYITKTMAKKDNPKNAFQVDDPDAPDDTVNVKIMKTTKVIKGKPQKITRKIYTLENGTKHIVEIEDSM